MIVTIALTGGLLLLPAICPSARCAEAFVRVGHGGPALSFDTLNGNIYIVRNQQQ